MAKTSRDTSSARWPWLVGASALLLAVAWCAWDDEPPVVVPEPLAEPAGAGDEMRLPGMLVGFLNGRLGD